MHFQLHVGLHGITVMMIAGFFSVGISQPQHYRFCFFCILRMDQHVQIGHLTVIDLRVQFLQPAALYRKKRDTGTVHGRKNPVTLCQLHDALGQQHIGPVLPLLPNRIFPVRTQLFQTVEYHGLHTMEL